jgi:hypothetical protein
MNSRSNNDKLLEDFLNNPDQADRIVNNFNNDRDCFQNLLNTAKESLSSFDHLYNFYELFAEYCSKEAVKHYCERNSARQLKNMVLRDSVSGRRFPIRTADEYKNRIERYRELGNKIEAENLTPRGYIFTLLEHIISKERHENHGYDILDNLLNESPEVYSEAINILVRARLIFAIENLDNQTNAVNEYINQFYSDFKDPIPKDNRSAAELREAAKSKSYENRKKLILIQSSLARQQDVTSLHEYLYLSFTDTVERYRHDTRQQPWRGELQLSVRQANCLKYTFDELELSSAWESRLDSYQRVALGELASGGRWRSQKDPRDLPNPDFKEASIHFVRAAAEIQPIDSIRYVKYISKSLRHLATASRITESGQALDWSRSRRIHQMAIGILTEILEQNSDNEFAKTVSKSISVHKFKKHESGVVISFAQGDPSKMIEEAEEAWSIIDNLPIYVDTSILEDGKQLAEALKLEMEGKNDEAIEIYEKSLNEEFDTFHASNINKIRKNIIANKNKRVLEAINDIFEE